MSKEYESTGLSVGSVIAGILSYLKWHSVGWCIVHTLFGWAYVVYYALVYGF